MKAKEILLVEDNPGDVELIQTALRMYPELKQNDIKVNISVVQDGALAMDLLLRKIPYEQSKRPDLIILDYNLPKLNGQEVLDRIKTSDNLKTIPVVILTTSSREDDIKMAYASNANSFVTKPIELDAFLEAVNSIKNFWLKTAVLPDSDKE